MKSPAAPFTITNPGVFGGLFGTPIINQPQVAILGVGKIEKRAKVLTAADDEDYIAIRQLAYFALSFDHRIIDGADAERVSGLHQRATRVGPVRDLGTHASSVLLRRHAGSVRTKLFLQSRSEAIMNP